MDMADIELSNLMSKENITSKDEMTKPNALVNSARSSGNSASS